MKKSVFHRMLAAMLCCVVLLLSVGCSRSDAVDKDGSPAEPDALPAVEAVRRDRTDVFGDMLNYVAHWSLVGNTVYAEGLWIDETAEVLTTDAITYNLFASADIDRDIRRITLPQPETMPETLALLEKEQYVLEEEQYMRSSRGLTVAMPDGSIYVLQEDGIYRNEQLPDGLMQLHRDAAWRYLVTLSADGVFQKSVPLPAVDACGTDGYVWQIHPGENGLLWLAVNRYNANAENNIGISLLAIRPEDGSCVKQIDLPEPYEGKTPDGLLWLENDRALLFASNRLMVGQTLDEEQLYGTFLISGMHGDEPVIEKVNIPQDCYDALSGFVQSEGAAQEVLITGPLGVYRWDIEKQSMEELFTWAQYGIDRFEVERLYRLSENELLVIRRKGDPADYTFSKLPVETPEWKPEADAIVVGVIGEADGLLRDLAAEYNTSAPEKPVQIKSYSDAAAQQAGFASGSAMLENDIIRHTAPDIVVLPNDLQASNYIQKGLFVDLYPYIDNDPELSREALVESVLSACEYGDALPTVVPAYMVLTAAGDPARLGKEPGWSWAEYNAVLQRQPQMQSPFYLYGRKQILLYQLLMGGDTFIDYDSGICALDTDAFTALLQASSMYDAEFGSTSVDPKKKFQDGEHLLYIQQVGSFRNILMPNYIFNEKVVYKGFPSDTGSSSAVLPVLRLGITSQCKDAEAAWAFLRCTLLPEFQNLFVDGEKNAFPLRRDVLELAAEAAREKTEQYRLPSWLTGVSLTEKQLNEWKRGLTKKECRQITALIESADVLYQYDSTIADILWEEADYFYNGIRSAEEAAQLIQNRVQTYLAEQS